MESRRTVVLLIAVLVLTAYSGAARAGHLNGALMTFDYVEYEWQTSLTDTYSGINHPEYDGGPFLGKFGEVGIFFSGLDLYYTGPAINHGRLSLVRSHYIRGLEGK